MKQLYHPVTVPAPPVTFSHLSSSGCGTAASPSFGQALPPPPKAILSVPLRRATVHNSVPFAMQIIPDNTSSHWHFFALRSQRKCSGSPGYLLLKLYYTCMAISAVAWHPTSA